jgi:hypothetical protein
MSRLRTTVATAAAIAVLASCGSGHKRVSTPAPSPSTTAAGGTATVSSTVANSTTSITEVLPTTPLPCQTVPIPATPVKSPVPTTATVLLTAVSELGDKCVDHVVFGFTGKATTPPGYTVTYGTAPFVQDGSGNPVAVKGNAFIVVKVQPAYGFDFENARATYTGPKQITPAQANHVTQIVETGDFEGVITWVIGLDSKRPFSVQATGAPQTQVVVTVS